MTEHAVLMGLQVADPSIPWPARGSGGRELIDRKGWERRTIPVMDRGKPSTAEAMCRGELAVNVMLEGEGFAICLATGGFRISYGGRVFARCEDAMVAAEAMMMANESWERIRLHGFSQFQASFLSGIMMAAEQRGQILIDRIYPHG